MKLKSKETQRRQRDAIAAIYVNITRNGSDLCAIFNITPLKLHRLTSSSEWQESFQFWSYTGNGVIEGVAYNQALKRAKQLAEQKRDLQKAKRLWTQMFADNKNEVVHAQNT